MTRDQIEAAAKKVETSLALILSPLGVAVSHDFETDREGTTKSVKIRAELVYKDGDLDKRLTNVKTIAINELREACKRHYVAFLAEKFIHSILGELTARVPA